MRLLLRRKPPGRRGVATTPIPPFEPKQFINNSNEIILEDDYNIILKRGDYDTILDPNR